MVNRIKEYRDKKSISQIDLAKKVGIAVSTLCDIENNKQNPSLPIAFKIADALKTTVDKLFREDDVKSCEN